jgi:cytochrome P450
MLPALRLYPSVPVNSREAVRDTLLPVGGGPDLLDPVFVPKGTAVAYSVYAMHRRPDFFGMDAELFRPERWDENMPLNDDPVNAKWGYLPFNGGPRVCLGMDFGFYEAAYTVVRLLQRFPGLRLPMDEKVELVGVEKQTMTLVVSITNGCRVQL